MGRDYNNSFSRPDQATIAALPPLVQQIRERLLDQLIPHLARLLMNSDRWFLELSSRATSNHEQNLYFESLCEVRSKHDEVLQRYRRAVRHTFEQLRFPQRDALAALHADAETLSLVGVDDIEQHVAITAMTSKARAANQEVLYQIAVRLRSLLPGIALNDDNNPLDPAQLCAAFRDALECLCIGTKSRLVILKQFDRDIMAALPGIYGEADRALVSAGILPEITSTTEAAAQPTPPTPSEFAATGASSRGETLAGELALLLAEWRLRGYRLPAFVDDYSSPSAPPLRSDELIHHLGQQPGAEDSNGRPIVRSTLSRIMAATAGPRSLAGSDEDIINLVAIFFDTLISDDTLDTELRVMLSRLQLPLLKLALRNPEFLGSPGHPARELINDIGQLGMGLDDNRVRERDPTLLALRETVAAIESANDLSRSFFERLRTRLAAAVQGERTRAARVEARVKDTAAGQAKAQAARARVLAELQQRLLHVSLPQAIATFIMEQWQPLLLLTFLRHGAESTEWLESLQLVDDLVWCSQNHSDEKSRARQLRLAPSLQEQIREGLSRSAAGQPELDAIAKVMEAVCGTTECSSSASLQYVTIPPEQLAPERHNALGRSWQDAAPQEQRVSYEHVRTADRLAVGDWLAFSEAPGQTDLRCKLAAKLPETDCYVFVDRLGSKILEKKRRDLAYDLQLGRAIILDMSPLFERTMQKLLTVLQTGGSGPGR